MKLHKLTIRTLYWPDTANLHNLLNLEEIAKNLVGYQYVPFHIHKTNQSTGGEIEQKRKEANSEGKKLICYTHSTFVNGFFILDKEGVIALGAVYRGRSTYDEAIYVVSRQNLRKNAHLKDLIGRFNSQHGLSEIARNSGMERIGSSTDLRKINPRKGYGETLVNNLVPQFSIKEEKGHLVYSLEESFS